MDKARIDEREKVNAIQLEADKVFEKGVREHERKKTAEEIKTHLLSLMQDTSKPSFADNIKLQAYNEVLDQAIDDIEKKFPGQKVALLYQTRSEGDNNAYDYITDAPTDKVHFKFLACNTLPRKANFDLVVIPDRPNVMIVSILDIGFADSLLHKLARTYPTTHFEIYGMPSWLSIPDLRKEGAFPNITVNITTPFIIDPATTVGQYVKRMYKENYSGKISESVYRGYETMFWYANLLKKYGTHFSEKYGENMPAPFTQFDIKPIYDKGGHEQYYENKHIFLSTYEGGVYKIK